VIYFDNRQRSIGCMVRDITTHGARIAFALAASTPDEIELHIPQKDLTVAAEVMWRRGREMGVSFFQTQTDLADPIGTELAGRMARLDIEIAALKRMLRRMKSPAVTAKG